MFFCELCGSSTISLKKVMIDNSVFNVCFSCSKRGKPYKQDEKQDKNNTKPSQKQSKNYFIPPHYKIRTTKNKSTKSKIGIFDDHILIHNFGKLIRDARTIKGYTQEQTANRIGEKISLIKKIESGSIKPDDIVAKKIERFLDIKLYNVIDEQEEDE